MDSSAGSTTWQARCALLAVLAALAAPPADAQTWTGGGPDDNWSTGANWSGGVAPASGPATQVELSGPASVVDLPWTVNRITLFGFHTVSGQPITFAGAAPGMIVGFRASVANPIILTGPTSIFVSLTLDLTGDIGGTGSLSVGGPGGVALHGTNSYTGGTSIVSAGLGLHGTMLGPVTLDLGGSLRGSNGTVNGPVTVSPTGATGGTLTTGDLTVAGHANMVISGAGVGQHDTIRVNGTVTLNSAALALFGSYVPVPGDVFTLIENDGADAVTGTFAGLPQGAAVTFNGVPLYISYVGGTGNDVTLQSPGPPHNTPTLSQWALILLSSLVLVFGLRASAGSGRSRNR